MLPWCIIVILRVRRYWKANSRISWDHSSLMVKEIVDSFEYMRILSVEGCGLAQGANEVIELRLSIWL